jgi:hypothetical protein
MDRTDVRMVELGDGAGFAIEAVPELWIGCDGLGQDLNGDYSVQACFASLVDLSNAAGPERESRPRNHICFILSNESPV